MVCSFGAKIRTAGMNCCFLMPGTGSAGLVFPAKRQFGYPAGSVVEVGMDADDVHAAHDQQRWMVEVGAVFEKLVISGGKVFVPAFVFPAKEVLFPNVGPAVSAAVFGGASLKGEPFPLQIGLLRLGISK
jgi:hypothetical protein